MPGNSFPRHLHRTTSGAQRGHRGLAPWHCGWTLGGLPWPRPPFLGQFLLGATSQFLPPPRWTVGVRFLSFWFPCKLLPGSLIPMGTLVLVKLVWPQRLLATAQLQSLGRLPQDLGGRSLSLFQEARMAVEVEREQRGPTGKSEMTMVTPACHIFSEHGFYIHP